MLLPTAYIPACVIQSQQHTPVPKDSEPVSLVAKDARLRKKLTIARPFLSVNESLQLISEECNVPLRMRDQKILGAQKICVFAKDIEAYQLLEAIAALYHYKNISSEWERPLSTEAGYVLRSGGGDYLRRARQVKEQAKQNFLKDIAQAKSLLNKSRSELQASTDDSWVTATMKFFDDHNDTKYRDGLNAFFSGLTREQQNEVLSGKPVTVDNPSGNKALEKFLARDVPDPSQWAKSKITFAMTTGMLAPVLYIQNPEWTRNYVGTAADEQKARQYIVDDWITKRDTSSAPQEKKITRLTPAQEKPRPEQESNQQAIARLLSCLSEAHQVPIVALLPPLEHGSVTYVNSEPLPTEASPNGKSLESLLSRLAIQPYDLNHKWTNAVLVLRDPVAPFLEAMHAASPAPPPKPTYPRVITD